MFEWSDMRTFLAVHRAGSAAAAARALATNQTTVSRRIARLEAALSLTLFDIGPRGAVPTDAAARLLPHAVAMETAAAELWAEAQDANRRLSGVIRLTANPIVLRYAAGITRRFQALHPGATFEIDGETRTLSLEDGEADVALRTGVRLKGDTLIARKLFDHPWGIYASDAYIARNGAPRGFAELDRHQLIRFTGEASGNDPLLSAQARFPKGGDIVGISSFDGMVGLIRAGEGVGLLPRAEGDMEPGLSYCFGTPELVQGVWIVATRAGHADPLIRGFMRFCAETLPSVLRDLPAAWRA